MMIDLLPKDFDEIVAIMVNGEIYSKHSAFEEAKRIGNVQRIYSRAVFKFIYCMDSDDTWREWNELPTLFSMTEYREFIKKYLDKGLDRE